MKTLFGVMRQALLSFAALTFLCGIAYTGAVTVIAQSLFREKADGSIVSIRMKDGTVRDFGSALIGQEFTGPEYLIGRPAGTSNLSPAGLKEKELIRERVARWHTLDPDNTDLIPADLVTASGSGVDPYISPEAAEYQVHRLAVLRGMKESDIRSVIAAFTSARFLGVFGDPGVNALKVNLALDGLL